MPLVLNQDQQMIRDSARDFCTSSTPIAQLRKLRDEKNADGFDRDTWKQMVELGWPGIIFPEEFGGTGFGYFGLGLILEETGRTLAASPLFATVVLGGSAVLLGGDDAQKQHFIPRIIAGESMFALALQEGPHHAPYEIATRATRSSDGWRLHGRKVFVFDGHVADTLVVVARTSGGTSGRDGLTLFLVDARAAGVVRRRTTMADSRNAAIIEFNDVAVGADAVLGSVDAGADVLDGMLDRAAICLAAEMLGSAQAAFDKTLGYLQERKQFGVVIGSFQALKHRAADLYCQLELGRSVVMDALTALDERPAEVPQLSSLAKAKLSEVFHRSSNEAVQMHGGIGMTDEFDIGFYMKRSRVCEFAFGDTSFHRDRYARLDGY
jgi:alkylation response protein AidB-like acyl-CoA dehydrogenase